MSASPQNSRIQRLFALGLCVFMAVAVQIQATLFQTDTYEGIRLNLGDLALPIAGVFIAGSILLKKSSWPAFEKPFSLWWLAALTACLCLALVNGYLADGEWNRWALINKFAGWFVLMAYFGSGAWIASNFRQVRDEYFVKVFGGFFALVAFPLLVFAFLKITGIYDFNSILANPYEGLMANTNAYVFLLAAATGFITLDAFRKEKMTAALCLLWLSIPYIALLSGSRSMWICVVVLAIAFIVIDWKKCLRLLAPALVIGTIICLVFAYSAPQDSIMRRPYVQMKILYKNTTAESEKPPIEASKSSDAPRFKVMKLSYDIWKQHPIIGAGLGAIQKAQIAQNEETVDVVHNTILWLLAEMGAVGALIFAGCYISMLWALRNSFAAGDNASFALAAILMLLMFGLISLVHEILYTRFMWFILGLALARGVNTRQAGSIF